MYCIYFTFMSEISDIVLLLQYYHFTQAQLNIGGRTKYMKKAWHTASTFTDIINAR